MEIVISSGIMQFRIQCYEICIYLLGKSGKQWLIMYVPSPSELKFRHFCIERFDRAPSKQAMISFSFSTHAVRAVERSHVVHDVNISMDMGIGDDVSQVSHMANFRGGATVSGLIIMKKRGERET